MNEFNTKPLVPVSWGELIDKLTILEIKQSKITSTEALQNIETELSFLKDIENQHQDFLSLVKDTRASLLDVNIKLWKVEDELREKEFKNEFDHDFMQSARSVYILNDERARLKKNINHVLGSALVEEKSYTPYNSGPNTLAR